MSDPAASGPAPGNPGEVPPTEAIRTFGPYRITGELGKGGMGAVFRAVHETLERPAALKILPRDLAEDPQYVSRFLREARVAATLRHDNIVQVYDAGCVGGKYYIAMELVAGTSLAARLRSEGPPSEEEGLRLLDQAARGLAAAHEKGLVHRDIKPENLLLDERGNVRLADFGLVLESASTTQLTAAGATLGTPMYMSPEQVDGEKADARSDVYSLGAAFYHVFTGKPPFQTTTVTSLLYKHKFAAPDDPRKHRPELSEGLCNLILTMMAKGREDRPQSAQRLVEIVEAIRKGLPVAPPPALAATVASGFEQTVVAQSAAGRTQAQAESVAPASAPPAPARRKWVIAAGAMALLVILVVALKIGHAKQQRRQQDAQTIQAALQQARTLLDDTKPAEARKILEDAVGAVRPETPGVAEAHEMIGTAKESEKKENDRETVRQAVLSAKDLIEKGDAAGARSLLRRALDSAPSDAPGILPLHRLMERARELEQEQRVRKRYMAFIGCMSAEDWDGAAAFVDPAARSRFGPKGVRDRLKLLAVFAKLLKLDQDHVKVKEVAISRDGLVADVTPMFLLGNEWKVQEPGKWRRSEDEWYAVMK